MIIQSETSRSAGQIHINLKANRLLVIVRKVILSLARTFEIHRYSPNPILFNCLNLTINTDREKKT